MSTVLWIVSLPLRIVGGILFLAGALSGGYDLYHSVQIDRNDSTSLGELWYALHPGSLNVAQAAIQRHVSPALWDPWIQTLLVWPAWAVLCGLGIVLMALARVIWKPR